MLKFKVGDRVKIKRTLMVGSVYGRAAVVRDMMIYKGNETVVTEVSDRHDAYRLRGCSGWYWTDEMLEPADVRKIVVTVSGATTIARLYINAELKKEAKAVCSTEDTFDFDIGAKLAMERLMAEDKPKLYNGKVVCIEASVHNRGFTKGKIYRFAEGFMVDDDNEVRPATGIPIKSFEDLKKKLGCLWLEVVE